MQTVFCQRVCTTPILSPVAPSISTLVYERFLGNVVPAAANIVESQRQQLNAL